MQKLTLASLSDQLHALARSHEASLGRLDGLAEAQGALLREVRSATAGVHELQAQQQSLAERLELPTGVVAAAAGSDAEASVAGPAVVAAGPEAAAASSEQLREQTAELWMLQQALRTELQRRPDAETVDALLSRKLDRAGGEVAAHAWCMHGACMAYTRRMHAWHTNTRQGCARSKKPAAPWKKGWQLWKRPPRRCTVSSTGGAARCAAATAAPPPPPPPPPLRPPPCPRPHPAPNPTAHTLHKVDAQLQALNEAAAAVAAGPSSPRGFGLTAGLSVSGSAASGGGAVRGARPRSAGAPQRQYGSGTTGDVVVHATPSAGYQHLRLTAGVGEQAADGPVARAGAGTACADAKASPRSPSRMPVSGVSGGRGSGGGGGDLGDLGGGDAGFIGALVSAQPQ